MKEAAWRPLFLCQTKIQNEKFSITIRAVG
jgi:hypothetical protein